MSQGIRQLFSGANVYIYVAEYIAGDSWWLDKDGQNWWNRKDHFHHNAIYLPKVGEFDLKIGYTWHHICPGNLVYIPADSDLEFYFDENGALEKYYIHFDLTFGTNQLSDYFKVPSVVPLSDTERAEELFRDLLRFCADCNTPISQIAANGLLFSLVAELLSQGKALFTHIPQKLDKEMREAVEYIESHYNEPLAVSTLAERVGYSLTYFTKKFKKAFGCTPTDYIANLKISYAKNCLKTGSMPISDIASALGFCDVSYFSNFFKAKTGLCPGYYRNNGKE